MRNIPAVIAIGLVLAGPTLVAGQVYDPSADFSATSNPNGVWSYGWSQTLGSNFNFDTSFQNGSGLDFWAGPIPNGSTEFMPYIAHNGTNATITYAGALSYPPGQIGMHPGPNGEYSVIRFTALQAVLIDIQGSFFKIDPFATTDVHVLDNGVSIFDGAIGASSTAAFSLQRPVVPGETIDFAVGYGSNGTYYGDSTGLSATIVVPEPGSLALLGAAAGGWALWRRRRKALNSQ